MASSYTIQKKWIENFSKSPLVCKDSGFFKPSLARQLYYGKKEPDYPEDYPSGFEGFYNAYYNLDRTNAIETALRYLHFIGVKIRKEAVNAHLQGVPDDYFMFLKRCNALLRTLAHHRQDLNLTNPYSQNYKDIDFLIRIENGQGQLTIFDVELPDLYNRYIKVPDGYEQDPVVTNLFEKLETTDDSFFITGKAGTGKSTFIHYFTQKTKKQVVLAAFTGIAAINVGGVTLHSFFKFPHRALLPDDEEIKTFGESDQRRKIIEDIDTIVIDEVSMLRADILQAIDFSLRKNGGVPGKIFGGKQIIFVGDLFQLPPVTNTGSEVEQYLFTEVYNSPYFFDCDAYKKLTPAFYEFKTPQRQREDHEFVELLDKVRDCDVDDVTMGKLNARYDPHYVAAPEDFIITLTTNNYIANAENDKRLREINFMTYNFPAETKGDFGEERLPTHQFLSLKKDAQVIFIKNDISGGRRWVNGTIGKIEFIADDIIEVRLPDGTVHKLEKETWEHRGYKYDRDKSRVTSEAKGTFTQYPIKLAWAITIHKSQGLTFDNVVIDLGTGAFVNGQLYTALSRCRKLSGIVLKRKIKTEDIIQDERLMDFYRKCKRSENPS
ncbi:MAG TPA: DEAD/DEAH box helicase [Chryseolinea sp.]|nr:DEAD/DEAH box helicase [Chryseolinea sp.]